MIDWDDAFDNSGYVADSHLLAARWAKRAQDCRQILEAQRAARLDLAYGPGPRNRLDLFTPDGEIRGLILFVHGGYWHKLDKSYWSQLALPALAAGWAFAIPSYTLAPAARIGAIACEIAAAIEFCAVELAGPIRLIGHSAGGQLVARLACTDAPLAVSVQNRLQKIVAVSGIFDLRPLLLTRMNEILGLDQAEAAAESPALLQPSNRIDIHLWVGARERPEFLRQTRLACEAWQAAGARVGDHYQPGENHFSMIDGLAQAQSALTLEITA